MISRLERDFAANERRVRDTTVRLGFLNQKLNEAGLRYAVLKGFSLVPQFCPDTTLCHRTDFDYLVDDQWLFGGTTGFGRSGIESFPSQQEFVLFIPTSVAQC